MSSAYPQFLEDRIELEPNERVVEVFKQHWYVFRDPFLIGFFTPFMLIFLSFFLSSYLFADVPTVVSFIAKGLLYISPLFFIIGFSLFLYRLYLWYKTSYVVTDNRLIIVKQKNLFSLEVKQMELDRIQDVTYQIEGIQASLYGYGDISVQSASKETRLILERVGSPHEAQKVIVEAANKPSSHFNVRE